MSVFDNGSAKVDVVSVALDGGRVIGVQLTLKDDGDTDGEAFVFSPESAESIAQALALGVAKARATIEIEKSMGVSMTQPFGKAS